MENRFIRLTTQRKTSNSSRFENMLMTARRTPLIGGYGAAAKLQVINSFGASTTRTSFFRRTLFTRSPISSTSKNLKTTVVKNRLDLIERQQFTNTKTVPPATAAFFHRTLKERLSSNAQLHEARTITELNSGSLDPRHSRVKSPRNAEYLQRLSLRNKKAANSRAQKKLQTLKNAHTINLKTFRRTKYKTVLHSQDHRIARSSIFVEIPRLRKNKIARRLPTLVSSSGIGVTTKTKNVRRLFTRHRSRTVRSKLQKLVLVAKKKAKQKNKKIKTFNERSILHYRRADARSSYNYFTKKPIILNRSIQLKRLA